MKEALIKELKLVNMYMLILFFGCFACYRCGTVTDSKHILSTLREQQPVTIYAFLYCGT